MGSEYVASSHIQSVFDFANKAISNAVLYHIDDMSDDEGSCR